MARRRKKALSAQDAIRRQAAVVGSLGLFILALVSLVYLGEYTRTGTLGMDQPGKTEQVGVAALSSFATLCVTAGIQALREAAPLDKPEATGHCCGCPHYKPE